MIFFSSIYLYTYIFLKFFQLLLVVPTVSFGTRGRCGAVERDLLREKAWVWVLAPKVISCVALTTSSIKWENSSSLLQDVGKIYSEALMYMSPLAGDLEGLRSGTLGRQVDAHIM